MAQAQRDELRLDIPVHHVVLLFNCIELTCNRVSLDVRRRNIVAPIARYFAGLLQIL